MVVVFSELWLLLRNSLLRRLVKIAVMRHLLLATLFLQLSFSFSQENYCRFVNPFIGTGGHGHTYPGVSEPFGMMQLSPDSRLEGWDGCGGYHYTDKYIYGFSHTHLS